MKFAFFIFVFVFTLKPLAQESISSVSSELNSLIVDEYSAKKDISNKIIKLYIPGRDIGCGESKKDKEIMDK